MTTPVLVTTLDDLLDNLWGMYPSSRFIYEGKNGAIAIRHLGSYKWYMWSDKAGGYVWVGNTSRLGRFVTRWKRI